MSWWRDAGSGWLDIIHFDGIARHRTLIASIIFSLHVELMRARRNVRIGFAGGSCPSVGRGVIQSVVVSLNATVTIGCAPRETWVIIYIPGGLTGMSWWRDAGSGRIGIIHFDRTVMVSASPVASTILSASVEVPGAISFVGIALWPTCPFGDGVRSSRGRIVKGITIPSNATGIRGRSPTKGGVIAGFPDIFRVRRRRDDGRRWWAIVNHQLSIRRISCVVAFIELRDYASTVDNPANVVSARWHTSREATRPIGVLIAEGRNRRHTVGTDEVVGRGNLCVRGGVVWDVETAWRGGTDVTHVAPNIEASAGFDQGFIKPRVGLTIIKQVGAVGRWRVRVYPCDSAVKLVFVQSGAVVATWPIVAIGMDCEYVAVTTTSVVNPNWATALTSSGIHVIPVIIRIRCTSTVSIKVQTQTTHEVTGIAGGVQCTRVNGMAWRSSHSSHPTRKVAHPTVQGHDCPIMLVVLVICPPRVRSQIGCPCVVVGHVTVIKPGDDLYGFNPTTMVVYVNAMTCGINVKSITISASNYFPRANPTGIISSLDK